MYKLFENQSRNSSLQTSFPNGSQALGNASN